MISFIQGLLRLIFKNFQNCPEFSRFLSPKAQLTLMALERLFCCLSDARTCAFRVADSTPKRTATCSRIWGRQDSGRFLSHLRMEFEEVALLWPFSCS